MPLKLAALTLLLGATFQTFADDLARPAEPIAPAPPPSVSRSAQSILPKIHSLNSAEVPVATWAQTRSCNSDVAHYAEMLAKDHSNMDIEVARLAEQRGVDINQLSLSNWEKANVAHFKQAIEKLRLVKGCRFDRQFLLVMRDVHGFAIRVVQSTSLRDADAPLKDFLKQALQGLRDHFDMATRLLKLRNIDLD